MQDCKLADTFHIIGLFLTHTEDGGAREINDDGTNTSNPSHSHLSESGVGKVTAKSSLNGEPGPSTSRKRDSPAGEYFEEPERKKINPKVIKISGKITDRNKTLQELVQKKDCMLQRDQQLIDQQKQKQEDFKKKQNAEYEKLQKTHQDALQHFVNEQKRKQEDFKKKQKKDFQNLLEEHEMERQQLIHNTEKENLQKEISECEQDICHLSEILKNC